MSGLNVTVESFAVSGAMRLMLIECSDMLLGAIETLHSEQ
jgi:hypothetical protein